jgi:hypothetical protein
MHESTDNKGYICSNVQCRKTFVKPLKATNLQQASPVPYNACPYCLTEVTEGNQVAISEESAAKSSQHSNSSKPTLNDSAQCKHEFGFLSQQSLKGQIPDECMVCKDVVHCMLKKTLE